MDERQEQIEIQPVGYKPYNQNVRIAQRRKWATYEDVTDWIFRVTSDSFHIPQHRSQIRNKWYSMVEPCPFNQLRRFPPDAMWVNMENRKLITLVGRLLAAIDIPNRFIEKETSRASSFSAPDQSAVVSSPFESITNLSDAQRAFNIAVDAMRAIIYSDDISAMTDHGIYDRETFENAFGLTWINPQ